MLEARVSSSPLLADEQDGDRAQPLGETREITGHRTHSDSVALISVRSPAAELSAAASGSREIGFDSSSAKTSPAAGHELTRSSSLNAAVKRLIDVVGAIVLAATFLPLMLPLMVAMSFSSGSVIYRHRRVGQNGKIFKCYKFRTMVPNADKVLQDFLDRDPALKAEWLQDHKLRDDPRITTIGRFLRRTSLDELPQVWNVLKGEMSLVGPRPVVKEELLRYGRNVSAYLSAKPGITGLWQVSGRNDMDYRRRVAIDVYYVRNRSVLLDLYILIKTAGVVLGGSGAY